MKCTFFNGAKALANLGYAAFRKDPISIASSGSDVFQVGYSCVKKFASRRERNPFEFDLSNVKFDSSDFERLRRMEAAQRFRESPLNKVWQRKTGFQERKLIEEIKRQSGLVD